MSDSLRDQLIAAGYKAPKEDKKKQSQHKKKSNQKKSARKSGRSTKGPAATNTSKELKKKSTAEDEAAIEQRKKLKSEIKTLIDDNKLNEWKGEIVYRYLVDSRIRELYVKEEIQQSLAARELAITRLNGDTYLVPRETALSIRQINPQWSVFNLEEQKSDSSADESEEYSNYKVPDDLKW